jgi:hypothetical protein
MLTDVINLIVNPVAMEPVPVRVHTIKYGIVHKVVMIPLSTWLLHGYPEACKEAWYEFYHLKPILIEPVPE